MPRSNLFRVLILLLVLCPIDSRADSVEELENDKGILSSLIAKCSTLSELNRTISAAISVPSKSRNDKYLISDVEMQEQFNSDLIIIQSRLKFCKNEIEDFDLLIQIREVFFAQRNSLLHDRLALSALTRIIKLSQFNGPLRTPHVLIINPHERNPESLVTLIQLNLDRDTMSLRSAISHFRTEVDSELFSWETHINSWANYRKKKLIEPDTSKKVTNKTQSVSFDSEVRVIPILTVKQKAKKKHGNRQATLGPSKEVGRTLRRKKKIEEYQNRNSMLENHQTEVVQAYLLQQEVLTQAVHQNQDIQASATQLLPLCQELARVWKEIKMNQETIEQLKLEMFEYTRPLGERLNPKTESMSTASRMIKTFRRRFGLETGPNTPESDSPEMRAGSGN